MKTICGNPLLNSGKMWEASRGLIKIMTIAPELDGSLHVMRAAALKGVVLSIGHSTANYEQIELAIDHGAAHVTHMFNAMKTLHHRDPGVVLGAMLRNELKIELIALYTHVGRVMELLIKLKGSNGIILITDYPSEREVCTKVNMNLQIKKYYEGKPCIFARRNIGRQHTYTDKSDQKYDQKSKCKND